MFAGEAAFVTSYKQHHQKIVAGGAEGRRESKGGGRVYPRASRLRRWWRISCRVRQMSKISAQNPAASRLECRKVERTSAPLPAAASLSSRPMEDLHWSVRHLLLLCLLHHHPLRAAAAAHRIRRAGSSRQGSTVCWRGAGHFGGRESRCLDASSLGSASRPITALAKRLRRRRLVAAQMAGDDCECVCARMCVCARTHTHMRQ